MSLSTLEPSSFSFSTIVWVLKLFYCRSQSLCNYISIQLKPYVNYSTFQVLIIIFQLARETWLGNHHSHYKIKKLFWILCIHNFCITLYVNYHHLLVIYSYLFSLYFPLLYSSFHPNKIISQHPKQLTINSLSSDQYQATVALGIL